MAIHPNLIKRYKKVQKTFDAYSAIEDIPVKGRPTKRYNVKKCIQLTANKHSLSFARVERIIKMDLEKL